jgi:hypothetical protein
MPGKLTAVLPSINKKSKPQGGDFMQRCLSLFLLLLFAPCAIAAQDTAAAQFAQLKTLAGKWDGQAATITYKVSEDGATVRETLALNNGARKVTTYFLDGDKLMMKHDGDKLLMPSARTSPAVVPLRGFTLAAQDRTRFTLTLVWQAEGKFLTLRQGLERKR